MLEQTQTVHKWKKSLPGVVHASCSVAKDSVSINPNNAFHMSFLSLGITVKDHVHAFSPPRPPLLWICASRVVSVLYLSDKKCIVHIIHFCSPTMD